jgi:hypothetical protein
VCERGLRGGGTRGHGDSTENSEEPFFFATFALFCGQFLSICVVFLFVSFVSFCSKFFLLRLFRAVQNVAVRHRRYKPLICQCKTG